MSRHFLFAIPLALSLVPIALAQEPRFGATVEVRIIEVEAMVTDRHGEPVLGLKADDFEIFEGRSRQEITNFAEYRSAAPAEPAGAPISPSAVPTDDPEPRTIVLVIDSFSIPDRERARLFEGLGALIREVMRPQDRVGIVRWEAPANRPRTLLDSTTDRDAVLDTLGRLGGTRVLPDSGETLAAELDAFAEEIAEGPSERSATFDPAGFLEITDRFRGEERIALMRRKAAGLQHLVAAAGSGSGRKVVVFVSNDFTIPAGGQQRVAILGIIEPVARTANAGGVSLYGIHPRSPNAVSLPSAETRSSGGFPDPSEGLDGVEGLLHLAEPTGGLVDHGAAAAERLAPRIAADLGSYYSIGYRARSDGRGRERPIRVRVKNGEYRVRARRSWVEKSSETFARDQLMAHLFGEEPGQLAFGIEAGPPRRAGRGRWHVPVTLTIPTGQLRFEEERGALTARVRVLILAAGGIAELSKTAEERLTILRPAGGEVFTRTMTLLRDEKAVRVAIGIVDERTGLAAYGRIELAPPGQPGDR